MKLIERILREENLKAALKAVKQNKDAAGIEKRWHPLLISSDSASSEAADHYKNRT